MVAGVSYQKVDDVGLHIMDEEGKARVLEVDNVIVCAGQEPLRELQVRRFRATMHGLLTTSELCLVS